MFDGSFPERSREDFTRAFEHSVTPMLVVPEGLGANPLVAYEAEVDQRGGYAVGCQLQANPAATSCRRKS
jgi:hypothetical protein